MNRLPPPVQTLLHTLGTVNRLPHNDAQLRLTKATTYANTDQSWLTTVPQRYRRQVFEGAQAVLERHVHQRPMRPFPLQPGAAPRSAIFAVFNPSAQPLHLHVTINDHTETITVPPGAVFLAPRGVVLQDKFYVSECLRVDVALTADADADARQTNGVNFEI